MAKRKTEVAVYDKAPKTYAEKYANINDVLTLLSAAQMADHDMREMAREAFLFVNKRDGQWEPYWWHANADKPRYTFDMTTPIIDQITGELLQSEFDVRVSPGGGNATKELAMTYDGLIRNIENISNARDVYDLASRGMVTSGFDAWRVVQRYADDDSFYQDLYIEKINNAVDRLWFDPAAELQDKSDARYAFVLHPVSTDEYRARWPKGSSTSVDTDREGEAYYDKAECILIGEILYVEERMREIVLLSNGSTHEVTDDYEKIKDELAAKGLTEVKRRKRADKYVCSRFFDGNDFLEDKTETVFSSIPVVPLYANFQILENKTIYWGAVEKVIDSQRVMNYSMSREIEEGALAPRAKYWMTQAQAAGHETKLSTLNTNSDPVQFYNFDPEAPMAMPQQQGGAQINPGLRTISESMRQIIGQSAGMFAANMGDNPGLQSGVAIERLQNKGDNGTIKYFRAREIAIAYTGKLLVKAIPKVYDTPRQIRLMYEDGTFEMTALNEQQVDQQTGKVVTLNDLSQGTYDVVCKAGPSFRNRQEETIDVLLKMSDADPSILQLGGDLLLQAVSTPVSEQLAERKRAMMLEQGLIPEKQWTDEEKQMMQAKQQQSQQAQDPAMVLAQAEQMKAQAEMLNAQNKQQELQLKMAELQLKSQDIQASGAIDVYNAETNRFKAETEAQAKGARIEVDTVEAQGKQLDNLRKTQELMIPPMTR